VLGRRDEEELVTGVGTVKTEETGVMGSGSSPRVRFGKASNANASRKDAKE